MSLGPQYTEIISQFPVVVQGGCSELSEISNTQIAAMRPFTWAPTALRQLNGVFCVYKPTGQTSKHVKDVIKKRLVMDLNALPCYEHELKVHRQQKYSSPDATATVPSTTNVPSPETDYSSHRLVLGKRYITEDIRANYISGVPKHGSGVLVFGIGRRGAEYLEMLSYAKFLRVYHVKGKLGYCTDDGMAEGKFVQRTTFRHVTKVKMDKICGALQSEHQKLMFEYAGVDPNSQEAYELASQGIVRPADNETPPILYGVKCIDFNSPDFTLEIHSINETSQYLSDTVHNMGLRLKSSAVCTHFHRIRYGHFELSHTLLRDDWNLEPIVENIRMCERFMTPKRLLTSAHIGVKDETSVDNDSASVDESVELGSEDIIKSIVAGKSQT